MSHNIEPYCLVLGGGGAKGVYHIGVWQALKEMDIPVHAFIGNSIGAVIAAYLVQGADDALSQIVEGMNLSSLIRLNKNNEQISRDFQFWRGAYEHLIEHQGLDTSPMRNTLETDLSEQLIRDSGFDFGLTTVNLSDLKPREVFIEHIEEGELINYVMASAAFPGFSNPSIQGKKYLDGGIYDNVPYNMARRRGYNKIILVDITGIGFSRRPKTEGTQTVFIKASKEMGSAFDFSRDFLLQFRHLGYLDAMKAFGRLCGARYFIEPNQQAESDFDVSLFHDVIRGLPDSLRNDKRYLMRTLELSAQMLNVECIHQYSYASLTLAIQTEASEAQAESVALVQQHGLDQTPRKSGILEAFIKEIMANKKRQDSPYFYLALIRQFRKTPTLNLIEKGLRKLHPELAVLEIFLNAENIAK